MRKIIFILLINFSLSLFGQSPHLKGNINLDIEKGLVTCHFKITNTSPNASFSVSLNRGFNLKNFTLNNEILDISPKINYNTIEYDLFALNSSEDALPLNSIENIEVDYTGAFPIFEKSQITSSDDMGVIAIKNNILRATAQSVFIPELKDRKTNKNISSYTFDITVNCNKPETVYLNGCKPQTGKILHFVNNTPLDFLIYAGKYNVKHQGNLYLLNTTLDKEYVNILAKATKQISEYYSKIMGLEYDENIVFPQIFSIGPKNQYEKWAFTVTPTIVMNVNELSTKIDLKSQSIDTKTFQTIAHEMAHKYHFKVSNTKNLWRFYHETFAQYLSFKAVENLISKEDYQNLLNKYTFTNDNKKKEFVPFDEIENSNKDLTRASYDYYTLYLIGFEKMFGIDKTLKLLKQLVIDKEEFTFDTEYFKKRALGTGISKQDFEKYEANYLNSKNCINQF
jgi:hypothetical protein